MAAQLKSELETQAAITDPALELRRLDLLVSRLASLNPTPETIVLEYFSGRRQVRRNPVHFSESCPELFVEGDTSPVYLAVAQLIESGTSVQLPGLRSPPPPPPSSAPIYLYFSVSRDVSPAFSAAIVKTMHELYSRTGSHKLVFSFFCGFLISISISIR